MLDPVAHQPYSDPDDFIREVTDRIWVDREVDHILENYEPDSIVHVGLGTVTTRDAVVEASLMRMADSAQHPGSRPGQAVDVVWEARGDDAFLSSHLIMRAESRLVDDRMRRLQMHSIATCLYRRGRMVEEWIVRDSLARALQTGVDPAEAARELCFTGYSGSMLAAAPEDPIVCGDTGPRPDDHREAVELVLDLIQRVWNGHDYRRIHDLMIRDVFLHSVGETTYVRPLDYQNETLRLALAFPRATFEVRDIQTNFNPDYAGLRVAVLWKLVGPYDGRPVFGPVTNQRVDLLGVSQFLVQHGKIVRERRVWDELALRAQINAARGDGPDPAGVNICFT